MRSNKRNNKLSYFLTLLLCLCMLVGCGSGAATQVMLKAEDSETESYVETVQTESAENDPGDETEIQAAAQVQSDDSKQKVVHTGTASAFNAADVPAYSGEPYTAVNNNEPYFTSDNLTTEAFENYSELDALGRCGVAHANVCLETMPTEKRGSISEVKPTGWHSVKYDNVDGKSLYNRCHLIGYQLTAENMVADYVKETDNHVLYRVTPIFTGDNLVADGVLMEGYSVEDEGDGICFCVYAYNVQPGITIDYATGDSWLSSEKGNSDSSSGGNSAVSQSAADKSGTQQAAVQTESVKETSAPVSTGTEYILNTNTKKFHYPSCSSVKQMKASNKKEYTGSRDDLIAQGYDPCKKCNP